MPGLNGTGPAGAGVMTGRGFGVCAGGRPGSWGRGRGCGMGPGSSSGRGRGYGPGLGRGLGWFSVGYGEPGADAANNIRGALEERKAFLRAELDRTEALLKSAQVGVNAEDEGAGER